MQLWSSSSLNFVRCIRNRRRFKEIQTADFTHNWMQRPRSLRFEFRPLSKISFGIPVAAGLLSGHLASFAADAFRKLSRGKVEGRRRRFRIHVAALHGSTAVPILLDDVLAAPVPRICERFSASLLQIQRFPGFFHLSAVNCDLRSKNQKRDPRESFFTILVVEKISSNERIISIKIFLFLSPRSRTLSLSPNFQDRKLFVDADKIDFE